MPASREHLRRITRALGAAVVLVGVLVTSRPALAAPTSRLVYVRAEGAESCPDEPELRRAVAARLGYDPFRPFASSTLTVEVKHVGRKYKGSVRLVDGASVERGARDLESGSDSCADLTNALALSMSLAIDPLSALRPVGQPPADVPPPEAETPKEPDTPKEPTPKEDPPPPAPKPPAAERPPPPEPSGRGVDLGLAIHGTAGTAPAPAFGMRLVAEFIDRRYSIGLEGRLDLPASADTSEGGRVRASLVSGALVPCLRFGPAGACAVLLAGRASFGSEGVSTPRDDATLFLAGGLRIAADIKLFEELKLRPFVEVLGHATPYELTVNGRTVYTLPTVSGAVGLAALRFF